MQFRYGRYLRIRSPSFVVRQQVPAGAEEYSAIVITKIYLEPTKHAKIAAKLVCLKSKGS
jgi:hypothetical protein